MEIGNFEDLMLFLKLELKLKIGRRTLNSCRPNWGALSGAFNCLVVFQNFNYPVNPS